MLDFKKITFDDVELLRPYIDNHNFITCDYSLGGIVLWAELFEMEYAFYKNVLFMRGKDVDEAGKIAYSLPIRKDGNIAPFDVLLDFHHENEKEPLIMNFIPEDALSSPYFPKDAFVSEMTVWADYLYEAQQLAFLAGKKMSKKRNKVSKFSKAFPNYEFVEITKDNISLAYDFLDYFETHHDFNSEIEYYEMNMNRNSLEHMELFGFSAYALCVGGKTVGVTLGEVCSDTLFVHVEKADIEYDGAYQALNAFFAKAMLEKFQIKFINREDDGNDEGLRKSKLSYHPTALLKKYKIALES